MVSKWQKLILKRERHYPLAYTELIQSGKRFFFQLLPQRWRKRLECSQHTQKDGCTNPGRERPKSLKRVIITLLQNARQQV